MSLLNNVDSATDVVEDKETTGAGGGFTLLDSNLYPATIKMAYLDSADSGAVSLNLTFDIDGQLVRHREWIVSGKAKGNKTYYVNAKGEKKDLPGFAFAKQLALVVDPSTPLLQMEREELSINLYDPQQQKEVPTVKEVITDLVNEEIVVGLRVVKENVGDKENNYQPKMVDGKYVYRTSNIPHKVFNDAGFSPTEIVAKADEPVFAERWKKDWEGVVHNDIRDMDNRMVKDESLTISYADAKKLEESGAASTSTGGTNTGSTKPTKKLFG